MFCIDDKVVSKKTGLPVVGTIVAIIRADIFAIRKGKPMYWTNLYPGWCDKSKGVYEVLFSSPQRILSFEECEFACLEMGVSDPEEIRQRYNLIPAQASCSYPEDDLELEK